MNSEQLGLADVASGHNLRAYAAELVGTMLFVLIGTGAVITTGGADLVAIALAHGIGIAVMVYATANYSGGHLNPAVTLAMMVTRRITPVVGVVYVVAQMVGACLATALLYAILFNEVGELTNFGAHGINQLALGDGGGLLLELVLTAALVAVIFAAAVSRRGFGAAAPLAIGLTVVVIHLIAVPLTGASVNPARTFGPALISNAFDSFWVYVIGPAAGAIVAAALYHYVFLPSDDPEENSAESEEPEESEQPVAE